MGKREIGPEERQFNMDEAFQDSRPLHREVENVDEPNAG